VYPKAVLRVITLICVSLLVAGLALWGAAALGYQMPGGAALKIASIVLWLAFAIGVVVALWNGRLALGLLVFAAAFGALLVWWTSILPSNHRVWADDVAQMVSGTVDGDRVTLHNVRNFDWRSDDVHTARWEIRSYDLAELESLDLIVSYWSSPAIAHTLISFGFSDGRHVVFSVEIRREKGETFSEYGGFFKEFELSVVAADEHDIVRVRTNVRGESDYLYRVRMAKPVMRSLFLAYVDEANSLTVVPRFYNTVTTNCTTLVYHMVKRIVGHLPLDYRILLSGYLPEYVYSVGGLDTRHSLEELRKVGFISERAKRAPEGADFSAVIREGIPPLGP
jgi:hypothetical protein